MCRINTLRFTHSSEKVAARHTTDQRLPETPAYELWLRCKGSERLLSSEVHRGRKKHNLWQSHGIRTLIDCLTKTSRVPYRQTALSEISQTSNNRNKDHSTIRAIAFPHYPASLTMSFTTLQPPVRRCLLYVSIGTLKCTLSVCPYFPTAAHYACIGPISVLPRPAVSWNSSRDGASVPMVTEEVLRSESAPPLRLCCSS